MIEDESEESFISRQKCEIRVLSSIYDKDLSILGPSEFVLLLRPNHNSEGFLDTEVSVELRVRFSETYPESIPSILSLQNPKGLRKEDTRRLESSVISNARNRLGEVMIMDIALLISSTLSELEKRTFKRFESFYEEMEDRKKTLANEKESKLALEKEFAQKQKEIILLELAKTAELLQEEKQKRKHRSLDSNDLPKLGRRHSSVRSSFGARSFSESCAEEGIDDPPETIFYLSKGDKILVNRGSRLGGSNSSGNRVYSGFTPSTGQSVAITKWIFKTKPISNSVDCYDENNLLRQISSIEQEICSIIRAQKNLINVVQILGISSENNNNKNVVLRIFEEFVPGSTLSYYLTENLPMDFQLLRYVAFGILKALDEMHEKNVVHRDLRDSSVYITSSGVVKVGNWSWDKRIRDLVAQNDPTEAKFPHSIGRGGKKGDIYRFGTLILSLSSGFIIQDSVPSVPKSLPSDFRDFLRRCFLKDERDRWTASQLLTHSFMMEKIENHPTPSFQEVSFLDEVYEKDDEEEVNNALKFVDSGHSRLEDEFSLIGRIGKGGFGEVIKVKNRLDGGTYAIKKIKLTLTNKIMTKKIMREVKLLSRLNHENVVRYYNSWMETATLQKGESDSSDHDDESDKKLRFSVSTQNNSEDDDAFSDEDEVFGTSFLPASWNNEDDSSDDIVFEGCSEADDASKLSLLSAKKDIKKSKIIVHQFLYIQMELCEKQTLRNAIDQHLYKDTKRTWRMFREILEGLHHIHSQGMIHRDLKPVNIFIDFSDHVKIGDFGLATTSFIGKEEEFNESLDVSLDNDLTGQVGTALYIAPEIKKEKSLVYNQKVDIYSLGIIFFEMCSVPLSTGMERIKVLTDLRSEDIIFPSDFDTNLFVQQAYIVNWLLNHDPGLRPTSYEILQSDYLPPPQVEEAELKELIRHTLQNTTSKTYHHLIETCMAQRTGIANDLKFDLEIPRVQPWKRKKILLAQEKVRQIAVGIFRKHGAVHVNVPIFHPKGSDPLYQSGDNVVEVMTRNGGVVYLPHDLRVHFARWCAKSNIDHIKRYCIGPVYREEAVFGITPRELIECAFDIVAPQGRFLADAEIILVADELLKEVGSGEKSHFVRINHSLLLKGLLEHCGVMDDQTDLVYEALRSQKSTKSHCQKRLSAIGLPDQVVSSLVKFLDREGSVQEMSSRLRHVTKRNNVAGEMIKNGISDLQTIISYCLNLGVETDILVAPSLVYNPGHFSGMFCQIVRKRSRSHKTKQYDVIAAGGRYDPLLEELTSKISLCNVSGEGGILPKSAVGISLSMDKLIGIDREKYFEVDVLLCSKSHSTSKILCDISKDIWAMGLTLCVYDELFSPSRALELSQETGASVLAFIRDSDVLVRTFENNRYLDRKMSLSDLLTFLSKVFADYDDDEVSLNCSSSASNSVSASYYGIEAPKLKINYNFKFLSKSKYTYPQKKRMESSINSKIHTDLKLFGTMQYFEVLVLSLPGNVLKTCSAYLTFENEDKFYSSTSEVIEKHGRFKKDLLEICDEIYNLKFVKKNKVDILYSIDDHTYKFLLGGP